MPKLDNEILRKYRKDSFVSLGTVFTQQEIAQVRNALQEVVQAAPKEVAIIREAGSQNVRSVMGWENAHPVLSEFTRDARILEPVQNIIGPNVVFHQTKYNPKSPQGTGEKWDPHRGFTFWHFLDGIPDAEKMISVFIALTEQTQENGATYTWKGAHNITLPELRKETDFSQRTTDQTDGDTAAYLSLQIKQEKIAEYDQQFEKVHLTGPAGSVWLMNSCNLHASPPNNSTSVRELVANVYRTTNNYPQTPRPHKYLCGTSNTPLQPYYMLH